MLDADLAELYGVATRRLNEQVRRNIDRFPSDFMFHLTWEEARALRSQIATLEDSPSGRDKTLGRGRHRKYPPYAFTEHGAIMAASVLNSDRAVKVSVYVVRAFVKLREMLVTHKELSAKLDKLERKLQGHDRAILALVRAIRQLMAPPEEPKRKPIGFASEMEEDQLRAPKKPNRKDAP